jgi:hypothetical protein
MKKFMKLLLVLLPIITTGCRTTRVQYVVILPPKPQREEVKAPQTVKECGEVINYYNSLVKLWEAWGDKVSEEIEKLNELQK